MGQEDKINPDSVDVVTVIPVLPLRDVVVYPHMVIPLLSEERSLSRRWTRQWMPIKRYCW